MMPLNTRKRKLSSVDSDNQPAQERHEASPTKRRSPRKRLDVLLNKENNPSPRQSPRKATGFPFKTSSFYGPKKSAYLTPLERKAVKESLPSRPPPTSSPGKAKSVPKETENAAKGKQTKLKASSSITSFTTKTKTIKLSKINWSSNASNKPPEPKKCITLTFNNMKKPKTKIFVGAAFFSTAKKTTSMHKKAATANVKRESAGKKDKLKNQGAAIMPEKKPLVEDVEPMEVFNSGDVLEKQLSSPKVLAENYHIKKELKIVLTRSPICTSEISSFNSKDENSKPVCELDDTNPSSTVSTPPKESGSVYPIFGSASKRSKSTPTQPSSTTKERTTRWRKEKHDRDQLIIDAGQKQFGATTCGSCGMVYSADNPEDNLQHDQFHQSILDSIKFVGWKKERVVAEFWDGKIIMVMPDDPKYAVKKAEDVRRIADNELGFQQMALSRPSQSKTYLFVNRDRMVVGCLVAESIRQAFRVLETPNQLKDMTKDDFMDQHRAWCCSTVPEKALCGVSRVWVFSLSRRQGVARRMLDTVRSTFMYGSHLTKEEIAFSDPTPDGKQFATAYCGTPTFLVYNFVA
ncbi:N-acetyltransferase ESCO2 [Corythoichthys intestinalis]|uniref:N-acetyltransferase ESCO2 n=1 Tax=Corythoichthys intestinalis TaxID=161448 RepID=UPI0025A5F860|nr:N-acetyltransferase ESCO2 [Corythoichthys intestinalis]